MLANRKGYHIEDIYFSNSSRQIEKWSFDELAKDPNKHVTEFYKNESEKVKKFR